MTVTESITTGDGAMSGPPLDSLGELLGGPRIDQLLSRAARLAPRRAAIRTAASELSYQELDESVSRCATALRALAGGPDVVIALAGVLDPVFAVGYFGISRSNNVSAVINPLLPEQRLAHVLSVARAKVAIVTPSMYARISAIRELLPELEHVVLTEGGDDAVPALPDLIEAASVEHLAAQADPESVACLQFTSGTTGAAKAACLTHRNLTVNAAQAAQAHRLTDSSVMFNYLPTFHLMHLTIGVAVAATHVLWSGENIPESVHAANRFGATHYYSLPMRLTRLAADPELTELEAPALRAIMSGGSAMAPEPAAVLTQHFGVPVVQGYGLAEMSPQTHMGDPLLPKTGSSGVLVAGAECRIVDVRTRAPVPTGTKGEIQVRGPQLMRGYLGRDRARDVDAQGWFSTGDIGYADTDEHLFVVDRIKDTFKCDNWLVSPTEIERILLRHNGVAECAVVDHPDEFSGAVAHGFVLPANSSVTAAELTEFVNSKVPYYEQLRYLELVDAIPRSPTGKVERRALRERIG